MPPHLVRLGRLVTVLTVVMILGLIILVAAVVIRLQGGSVPVPDEIALPDGAEPRAVTFGGDWYAVVTTDDRILVFDAGSGALRQEILVAPAAE